jgi:hypothetical protein
MPLLTLGECKSSLPITTVIGASTSSPDFVSRVNGAVRQLMRRGSWWGTVQPIAGCIYDGCLVWPRAVSAVLAMNVNHRPLTLANRWFQFMPWDGMAQNLYRNFKHKLHPWVSDADGSLPVYRQIPGGMALWIRFYVDNLADIGKTITVYGLDENNQNVRTRWPDGTTRDGVVISIGSNIQGTLTPYSQTPFAFQKVTRILKDVTLGNVRMYMLDSNGIQSDMAVYQPQETSPDYPRSRIRGFRQGACGLQQVEALVKLSFIPVVNDSDVVLIENIDALADMIQSKIYAEAGNTAQAMAFEQMAFRELNYQMRERFPDEQFIVNFRPFGNDALSGGRVNIGMI